MSQPGIGAMLHFLGGGSPKSASDYYGRKIVGARMDPEWGDAGCLLLGFDDGVTVRIWDGGQSCCEHRYMTTDDDVQSLVGGELREVSVREGPEIATEYDEHETATLVIQTDQIAATFVTHNEHNGYYGGFGLSLDEVERPS